MCVAIGLADASAHAIQVTFSINPQPQGGAD